MAFDWLTGGNVPQFWKNYVSLFDDDKESSKTKYVVFDMETTGLDSREDVILSVNAIAVSGNAVMVGDYFEVAIQQPGFSPQSIALQGALRSEHKVVEAEAMIQFLNFIKNAVLVGHNVNIDIDMINQALRKLDLGRLKNPVMDTNVLFQRWKDLPEDTQTPLEEVCDSLKIGKKELHSASGNAYATALLFLKLKRKLNIPD